METGPGTRDLGKDSEELGMKRRKAFGLLVAVIVIAAGTALNLAGSAFAAKVLPWLYFDSLGTILSAAMCGFIPGILVGFVTNILKGITDHAAIYYSILNVLIAVEAGRFARKNMFRRFPHVLLPVVVFTFIGGVLGSLLTWMLDGGVFVDAATLFRQIGRDTLADLVDKAITVAVASGVLLLLPKKVYDVCNLDKWRDPDETKAPAGLHSLNTRIILAVSGATVLVAVVISWISIKDYHEIMIGEQKEFSEDVSTFAASFVDPERVDDYIENGYAAEGYSEVEEKLQMIWNSSRSIEFIYAYRIKEDGCHVVFDLDTPEVPAGEPGEVVPFDESFVPYLPELLAGEPIEPIISNDTFGWLLTVYTPIYDAKGTCQCYMAVDISMPKLMVNERIFITQLLSLFLGFYVLILAVAIYLAKKFLIKPINAMERAAGEFAYNSEAAREDSVESIRSMKIHTGDEIENLYHALTKTVEDTAAYIHQVSEKNQAITKLQNGLIVVMADLVENRDRCTGNHIKNTASYVRIIIDQMRREGIYSDALTDQFAEDVINFAPLHDIGKIKVPDAILNKPGKLTDEEFASIQQHAAYGGVIIAEAIEQLDAQDTGYLSEAKNLALSHHEKWDGSGYPRGLKGEEIPLSARIMAVADVFDALVSRRSYKEGMPFEKAMSIIREGSGNHFDPLIVQAFMDAEEELRQIADEKTTPKDA